MAKVFFAPTVAFLSGKIGEGVYMITAKQGMSYMRQYSYPTITEWNRIRGAEMNHLSVLWNTGLNEGYKTDMAKYAVEYHALANYGKPRSDRAYSPFAIFVKLMYAFMMSDPAHIDLTTIVPSDLNTLFPGCNTIAGQTAAGWLPITPSSQTLKGSWT